MNHSLWTTASPLIQHGCYFLFSLMTIDLTYQNHSWPFLLANPLVLIHWKMLVIFSRLQCMTLVTRLTFPKLPPKVSFIRKLNGLIWVGSAENSRSRMTRWFPNSLEISNKNWVNRKFPFLWVKTRCEWIHFCQRKSLYLIFSNDHLLGLVWMYFGLMDFNISDARQQPNARKTKR